MKIGLHDAEKDHFKHGKTFPNYALMKISAWHKAQGDQVDGGCRCSVMTGFTAARYLILLQ